MAAVLSFEQAPPIAVPFRFFLTAPLFAAAAGLYLLVAGEAVFGARAGFAALAFTHLVTVGFMLQAMCGALMQLAPVAVGANLWRPLLTGSLAHAGVSLGAALLAAAFALGQPQLFQGAAWVLGPALGLFVCVVAWALARTPAQGPTVESLRLALPALAITLALGVSLAGVFGWGLALPVATLMPVHAAWGLIAWSLVLVAGVSYLVVPMFQLTPAYPGVLTRWLARALFVGVLAWSALGFIADAPAWLRAAIAAAVVAASAAYALATLDLQRRRRRKVPDVTMDFFRLAMLALLAACALALAAGYAGGALRERLEMAVGVLVLVGFFVSVINGMLYKIVPFITWLHLQKRMAVPPNMNRIIAEAAMRRQYRLHAAALACLLAACALPLFAYPAGALLAASGLWLEWNLVGAVRLYRRHAADG